MLLIVSYPASSTATHSASADRFDLTHASAKPATLRLKLAVSMAEPSIGTLMDVHENYTSIISNRLTTSH